MADPSEFLSSQREDELAEFAEWLADRYFDGRVVDPESLARKKGITICRNDYGTAFDGLLEHRAGRFCIYCNTTRARVPERVRFTVGHELGHFFIDEHREALISGSVKEHGSFCDFRSKNPVEREADFFASNLLMPPSRLERELASLPVSLDTVLRVARRFQTSLTSAAVRIVELNRGICALILWQSGAFRWKRLSRDARAAGLRSALAPAEQVPRDSATGKVIAGEGAGGVVRLVTTAATWFSGISSGSSRDLILSEEALSLGEFGVLTLLTEHAAAKSFKG